MTSLRHTVIITGGTKGLGRALALEFARAGHRILAFYKSDEKAAARMRTELHACDHGSLVLQQDIAVAEADIWQHSAIQQAESLVLINNAWPAFQPGPLHLLGWSDFQAGMEGGLKGSWLSSMALLRLMARRGRGTIVNVLSRALDGLPPKGFGAYATSKHALRGLTMALAAEYSERGIRTFSISPGFMETDLTVGWHPRLLELIRSKGALSDPVVVARRTLELVLAPTTEGRGEDYPM